MTYTKPEIAVLGKALHVIEALFLKSFIGLFDGSPRFPFNRLSPAYDLDE